MAAAFFRTASPSKGTRSSEIRTTGPETDMAAIGSAFSSKIAEAMHLRPTACSSSSSA